MKLALILSAPLLLTACATTPAPAEPQDGIARAGLNERVYVDGPYVTPLDLLEDSRCPMNARCIWAGRTRLLVRVDLGSRSEMHEVSTDKPVQVADGQLSLVEVQPDLMAGENTSAQKPYRFGFRFAGGL